MNAIANRNHAPPPFLLGAALLFWGWQSGYIIFAVLMAAALEGTRWIKTRWDFSNEDFSRIWLFCTLLLLAATVFAFSTNEGPSTFRGFFQNPNLHTERNAGTSTARTIATLIRWLPIVFFLFMAAQAYSSREGVPWEIISLIMKLRWKKAKRLGQPWLQKSSVNISYPYFGLCLMAASAHSSDDKTFFWGFTALLAWGLWPHRSRGMGVWAGALGCAVILGYFGQGGLTRLQRYIETINPQWFFSSSRRSADPGLGKTALGQIGRIKNSMAIVIRLDTKTNNYAPTLLREASYRIYKAEASAGRGGSYAWHASNLGNAQDDFVNVLAGPKETTFVLLSGKTNTHVVNISCYVPGGQALLPLPLGFGRLEKLFVYELHKNPFADIMAIGPGLAIYDCFYGPGASLDTPPEKEDYAVPPKEKPALDQVITNLPAAGKSAREKMQLVSDFLHNNFAYSTWQELPRFSSTNDTPLSRFLLKTHKGHCEYFATATVLLLRELDIPARYAVGYAVHEGAGHKYVVRQRDAHAWCLVWNEEKKGWQDFDTTPASWFAAEDRGNTGWQAIADGWSRVMFELSKLRWGQTNLRQYVVWALVPVLTLLLYQIIFRSRRKKVRSKSLNEELALLWPGLDSEFYQLEQTLVKSGLVREQGESLAKWLVHCSNAPALIVIRPLLEQLLLLHYRYRFDPQGLSAEQREQLREQTGACLAQMRPAS